MIAWVALRESVTRRTAVAMVVALAGVGIMMVGGPGGAQGIGLVLSVVMTLAFALALVVTRHRRDISMAPAICLSQVLVLAVVAPLAEPGSGDTRNILLIALLGVGQMGLGLALLTIGARLISAAEVALITLLEVVFGPAWVWIAYSERPSTTGARRRRGRRRRRRDPGRQRAPRCAVPSRARGGRGPSVNDRVARAVSRLLEPVSSRPDPASEMNGRSDSTQASRRSCSAATPARTRPSTCSTPSPRA